MSGMDPAAPGDEASDCDDDHIIAALVAQRKNDLREQDLIDFVDMAARVGVDLDDLP